MGRGQLRGRVAETGSPTGGLVVVGLVAYRLMRQTGEDTMNRKLVYWAYCTYDAHEGRWARGFILAANREEATTKARKRVTIERRRVYKRLGMNPQFASAAKGGCYRVRVWKDPGRDSAVTSKHYTERRGNVVLAE